MNCHVAGEEEGTWVSTLKSPSAPGGEGDASTGKNPRGLPLSKADG